MTPREQFIATFVSKINGLWSDSSQTQDYALLVVIVQFMSIALDSIVLLSGTLDANINIS